MALIEGPAGIGKSRLLAEARLKAQERRVASLGACGSELERGGRARRRRLGGHAGRRPAAGDDWVLPIADGFLQPFLSPALFRSFGLPDRLTAADPAVSLPAWGAR